MPNYLRAFRPGGTFFLTLVTEGRAPIFAEENARLLLRIAMARCRELHPFDLDAVVLLHDHLHVLLTLPEGDADFSRRVAHFKSHFTRSYVVTDGSEQAITASRLRHRTRGIWQRRFWEHTIRDLEDLRRHVDYIHYNPVKHGYVTCPHKWPYSSFHRFVCENQYEERWCCGCDARVVPKIEFDDIADSAGE